MAINVTSSLVDNHAMLMCSVAASDSAAASLHRNIEAFAESCMVASVFAGISGVCFVAGRFRIERFLTGLFWFSGLLLIEPIACNAARKHVDKPKELESTSHVMQFLVVTANYYRGTKIHTTVALPFIWRTIRKMNRLSFKAWLQSKEEEQARSTQYYFCKPLTADTSEHSITKGYSITCFYCQASFSK